MLFIRKSKYSRIFINQYNIKCDSIGEAVFKKQKTLNPFSKFLFDFVLYMFYY